MYTLDELQQKTQEIFESLPFDQEPQELYAPIDYSMSHGGKRLRPLLALISCNLFNGKIEEVINPAIGLEIFHNFTLLHDDIMDQAPLRRGMPSVYTKWDTNTAILSGDTMFVLAYEFVTKTKADYLVEILQIFNQTAREVCEGQQYDMNYETLKKITIADYIEMIRLKTAVLIAASLKIGAVLGGASPQKAQAIYSFGINFGLAFQLRDDLLDVYGDVGVFGKQTGNDILTNKKTYLYLKAFEKASISQSQQLSEAYSTLEGEHKVKKVMEIFADLDIKAETEKEINLYYEKAIGQLNELDLVPEKYKILFDFASKLKSREV